MKKEIVIVGAGPAGMFAALNLANKGITNIHLFDSGKSIYYRSCPMRKGKACTNCKPCNIMHGFGGAGTFSDCKLSLSPYGVGGDIIDYIGNKKAEKYVKQVKSTFTDYFGKKEIIGTKTKDYKQIEELLNTVGLNLTYCPTMHLGTDGTYNFCKYVYDKLNNINTIKMHFNCEVIDIDTKKNIIMYKDKFKNKQPQYYDYLIFAPGRSGNKWLNELLITKTNIKTNTEKFDIGFRIEVPYEVTKHLTDVLYDMKISYTFENGVKVRTFCTNPQGYVSEEHYKDNIVFANGHSYANQKSQNTNFAVLVTLPITDFEQGYNYVKDFYNKTKNKIVINSYNEFIHDIDKAELKLEPTLKSAEHKYKLIELLPQEITQPFIEFMSLFSKVVSDFNPETTNVYGIEAKFYSNKVELDKNFETIEKGIYCIGDGAGVTRGIIQSACTGLVASDKIIKDLL